MSEKVKNLDFNDIKSDIKTYLNQQSQFEDYNFEGSALSTVIDVLAYVTHYNALNANMALNEAFLDSAQLRESIVSHAKLLGYTPRSAYSAVANIDIAINNPINVTGEDNTLLPMVMDKGTKFATIINNKTFYFVTDETKTIQPDLNGDYKFSNVKLQQGEYSSINYLYDKEANDRFLIPHESAVTSTLTVTVKESTGSTVIDNYVVSTSLSTIDESTEVYYLQEGRDGLYEISFGDGVLGKSLVNGNVITIDYLYNDNGSANNASLFSLTDTIQGNADVTITTNQKATGGSDKEDLESIRFNAPLGFVSQGRAVTPDDYKAIIQNSYANIDAISVWGGEDNDPPDYGKVYISIKPKDSEYVSAEDKAIIIANYLKPKNVVSITPTLVDPTYTYIYLEVFFKYNPNTSDLSLDSLENNVRTKIELYNDDELKRFDGVFRHSNILRKIDDTSAAIINSTCRVKMKKRFTPIINDERKYTLTYSSPIYQTAADEPVISSTIFVYKSRECVFRDRLNDIGERVIDIVASDDNSAVLQHSMGVVTESTGVIELTAFNPTSFSGEYIEITVLPDSNDIAPKRNELLNILTSECTISGEIDTMITGGTSAGIDYTTTTRH